MIDTGHSNKRDLILDTAEQLFARKGYFGTSVRDITDAADVRLASVNYYFKSKDKLYAEVLSRRADIVIAERRKLLEGLDLNSENREHAINLIVKAIVDPMFSKVTHGDKGWKAYMSLAATVCTFGATKKGSEHETSGALRDNSSDFIELLHRYSEHQTDRQAHYAFQFITSTALLMLTSNGRLDLLSENRYRSDDHKAIYPDIIRFLTAGTLAVLSH